MFSKFHKFLVGGVGLFLLGAFIGELAPDPTDAIHFWLQDYIKAHPDLPLRTITSLQIFDWYFLTASFFLLVLLIAFVLHIRKVAQVKIWLAVAGIFAVGVVAAMVLPKLLGG